MDRLILLRMNGWLLPFLLAFGSVQAEAPLSLSDAVQIALAQSPGLRAARLEAAAAQTQTDRERPVARPTIIAQAEGTLQGPRVIFPRGATGDATVLPERYGKVQLTVEQLLYRPGLGAARERYGAQTRLHQWEVRRVENDVILEVRRAYLNLLTAQAMAEMAHSGVEMAQKHLDLTKTLLEAGHAPERDVKAAEADLAEAEQGALKADNGVALARANLNRTLGRDLAAPCPLAPAPPLPAVPDSPTPGIEAALRQRPEIRLLEESLRAARAGIALARTQDKPALSARAIAAHQTATAFTNPNYFAASLVLTWNLYDAGKARLDAREAGARAAQIEALLEEAKLGVRLEAEKAWRDMREAQARIVTADRQVKAAEAALEVSELRYQVRSATQIEVAGALLNVTRARANHTQALYDLHLSAADYTHATGADVATLR